MYFQCMMKTYANSNSYINFFVNGRSKYYYTYILRHDFSSEVFSSHSELQDAYTSFTQIFNYEHKDKTA